MKRHMVPLAIVLAALVALIASQRGRISPRVSPAPALYLLADSENDLMRVPMELTRISDQDEAELGETMAQLLLRRLRGFPLPGDNVIAAEVADAGARLAIHAHRHLAYQFHFVADDRLVNAFALPGGQIFVGRGLMLLLDSQDELAALLGHEIEHVELRHAVESVQIEARLRGLPLADLASLPLEMIQSGYGKEQELEADGEGERLAMAAGYSPQGGVDLLRRLLRLEQQNPSVAEPAAVPSPLTLPGDVVDVAVWGSLQAYFRTHPPTALRLAEMQHLVASSGRAADKPQQALVSGYVLQADRERARQY